MRKKGPAGHTIFILKAVVMTCTHGHYQAKVCALVKPLERKTGPAQRNTIQRNDKETCETGKW